MAARAGEAEEPGVVVGVDVGGTKVHAAEVDDRGSLGRQARRLTPEPGTRVPALEDALTTAVEEVADGRRVAAVGLAAAGLVDAVGESVRFAPHLPWRDAPVCSRMAERWGVPVALENDANCAALAEAAYGAARGAGSVLLVAVGTGIGGALLLDGRLVRGHTGAAGEFGHMPVVPDGLPCPCGLRGCWEQYASGRALERAAHRSLGPDLRGPAVTAAAEAGEPLARRAFETVGGWLGVGIAGLVAAFDPELVVVSGGVSATGDLLLDPARRRLAASLLGAGHREPPPVIVGELGPAAGVVGAAMAARDLLAR